MYSYLWDTTLDEPVHMIEQDVDHKSGNGYIEPGWEDPASQPTVVLKAFLPYQV